MELFKKFFGKTKDESGKVERNQSSIDIDNTEIVKEEIESDAICPYCQTVLKKFPIRKTKCPYCKNFIFIRKLNNSNELTLITEKLAEEIDTEREKEYLKHEGYHNLESYGVSKDEFIKRKEEHYLKSGIENNNNDVVWSFYNELLIKNAYDANKLKMIYYAMAVQLNQEGKDNFKFLQLSAKAMLDSYQDSDLALNFHIIGCGDSCENCKKIIGKILSMEQAYLLPVPCKECTHSIGFCRCTYVAVPIRDSEGDLILKK